MKLTEQYLTPGQIKRGFTMEAQVNDTAILFLYGNELAFFSLKDIEKETMQNVADTLWKAYVLGVKDTQKLVYGDKLFNTVGKDIT